MAPRPTAPFAPAYGELCRPSEATLLMVILGQGKGRKEGGTRDVPLYLFCRPSKPETCRSRRNRTERTRLRGDRVSSASSNTRAIRAQYVEPPWASRLSCWPNACWCVRQVRSWAVILSTGIQWDGSAPTKVRHATAQKVIRTSVSAPGSWLDMALRQDGIQQSVGLSRPYHTRKGWRKERGGETWLEADQHG